MNLSECALLKHKYCVAAAVQHVKRFLVHFPAVAFLFPLDVFCHDTVVSSNKLGHAYYAK